MLNPETEEKTYTYMKLQTAPEIQILEEQEEQTELEPLYRVMIFRNGRPPALLGVFKADLKRDQAVKLRNELNNFFAVQGQPWYSTIAQEEHE